MNEHIADKKLIASMDLDAVFDTAKKHSLASIVGMALENAGVGDEKFKQAIAKAQRKTVVLNSERKLVSDALERSGIWYMPLKGSVLKEWYPQFGMRESADCDILFDPSYEDDVKLIMEELGYTVESYGKGHHDVYYKKPLTNMQMHVELFGPGYSDNLTRYYEAIKDRLILKSGHEYEFTPEDFYIYAIAHEWEHCEKGGTGLRSILDTYVMLKKLKLDWEYVRAETDMLGIREFEEKNRCISFYLFDDKEEHKETPIDQEMLDYILSSGVYGTLKHRIRNKMRKQKWNKLQYILNRFFVPVRKSNPNYLVYAKQYPVWYKHKIMLVFLPFYRASRAFSDGRIMKEIKGLRDA